MTILLFIAVLLVLVLVHEFGHFIVAKKSGIRVDEFAFGFPPRLFSFKKGETTYAFNLLPLGGYVKIHGENPDETGALDPDSERSFIAKPKWIQSLVIIAGIVFNLLLAWVLITTSFLIGVKASSDAAPEGYSVTHPEVFISNVKKDSPAELSGLKAGDTIQSLTANEGTVTPKTSLEVTTFIRGHGDQQVQFGVLRGGDTLSVSVQPIMGLVEGAPAVGIAMDEVGMLQLPLHRAVMEGAIRTVGLTQMTAVGLFEFFRDALFGKSDFSQVSGPVGMVDYVGQAAQLGVANLLLFIALISINLAVINVLPFPALDGWRFFVILLEAVIRRPIPIRLANMFNLVGFALLLLLMVAVTYHDIIKL